MPLNTGTLTFYQSIYHQPKMHKPINKPHVKNIKAHIYFVNKQNTKQPPNTHKTGNRFKAGIGKYLGDTCIGLTNNKKKNPKKQTNEKRMWLAINHMADEDQ
jgi:hypothetical protein